MVIHQCANNSNNNNNNSSTEENGKDQIRGLL
jgi:hypothetical protein